MKIQYCIPILFVMVVNSYVLYAAPQWENKNRTNIIDEEINLDQYLPFEANSKIVKLNEEATLKLDGGFPYLDGATALYPLYSAFANAVYPPLERYKNGFYQDENGEYTLPGYIMCSRTPKAYERLINGDVDIIFCTAPSDEQISAAREKGLTFSLTPIGLEAFVFFVNKNNPINGLSSSQIRSIYSGKIINWHELGGNNGNIVAYQRPKNSGSQTILELIMGGEKIIEPIKENMIQDMGPIIQVVASYENSMNAIGYSFLFYTTEMIRNNGIKLLTIDGIQPARETIKSGEYPFTQTFYAITTGNETEEVKRFIEWIISGQGQYITRKTGYVEIR
ncbi:MAG: substrate-binding domain-containing protein [Treponema sp.]|jgi:phosphate transport system substrate-binding protein|nr:substrate-binding domain-containing protein [Treponema sp.]